MLNPATPAQIKWVKTLVYNRTKSQDDFSKWASGNLDKMLASKIINDLKDYITHKYLVETDEKDEHAAVAQRKQQYARELLAQAGYDVLKLPQ